MQARLLILAVFLFSLLACQTPVLQKLALSSQTARHPIQRTTDQYLCVLEPNNSGFTLLKIMDLKLRTIRSLFVPGQVMTVDGVLSERKLFLSSREGQQEQPQFFLFEADIEKLLIRRVASFSQAGLTPMDFLVKNGLLYASGLRQGRWHLVSLDLNQGGWQNIIQGFVSGDLSWSRLSDQVQSVAFDEERIIRTTIDLRQKKIIDVQSFKHGIPFGNNIGLSSPDARYFYALHQFKGEVEIYSYDIVSGVSNSLAHSEKAQGILYSSVISQDGNTLYAAIDNKIHRYALQGTQMRRLPPIELRATEARHLALSQTSPVLYVSHDRHSSISQVSLNPDGSYTLQELPYPGQNHNIFVF